MQVRPARPEDAEAIERVARESWHAAYSGILSADRIDELVDEWYDVALLREIPEREDHALFVADDGGVVGFAHAASDPEGEGYVLYRLYVLSERWGEGIGTALIQRVEDEIWTETDRLRLTVLAENAVGVSFYESRGFERAGTGTVEEGNREAYYEKCLTR